MDNIPEASSSPLQRLERFNRVHPLCDPLDRPITVFWTRTVQIKRLRSMAVKERYSGRVQEAGGECGVPCGEQGWTLRTP